METILHKDIFYNIEKYLNANNIICLLKTTKQIYFFIFNYEFKNKLLLVFNYRILSQNQNILTNKNLSKNIISVHKKSNITSILKKYILVKKLI